MHLHYDITCTIEKYDMTSTEYCGYNRPIRRLSHVQSWERIHTTRHDEKSENVVGNKRWTSVLKIENRIGFSTVRHGLRFSSRDYSRYL